ncbi:MAG TPA: hypothetical protein VFC19_23770 [Candidatus Limnocylindrales bacterium]|nr:hypothetical protein [Candidatus Limnocylindrales bacterium]
MLKESAGSVLAALRRTLAGRWFTAVGLASPVLLVPAPPADTGIRHYPAKHALRT